MNRKRQDEEGMVWLVFEEGWKASFCWEKGDGVEQGEWAGRF